jgi:hypothetical protein
MLSPFPPQQFLRYRKYKENNSITFTGSIAD